MSTPALWEAVALLSEYGLLLDQDKLEQWAQLFEPQAQYKVCSRENEELALPAPLIWCDNRDMLTDRIQSYRNVNEHNFHWARHVIGLPQVLRDSPDELHFQASYSLFQTNLEGLTRLFSVGRYDFVCQRGPQGLRLIRATVIVDSGLVKTLLAAPI
jgi:anthranilate 1,2-dioxygenase small subunit